MVIINSLSNSTFESSFISFFVCTFVKVFILVVLGGDYTGFEEEGNLRSLSLSLNLWVF